MKKLIFCLSIALVAICAAAQEVQPSDSTIVREQIDSVTVSARRKTVNLRSDRLVVSLDGIEKDGKNAADMLKLAPSLTVSNSGISMAGRDKVLVYIDNRQLVYSGAELVSYLSSMPAGKLKKITVMSMPSSGQDAEGNIAVVRITTSHRDGWFGMLNASYGLNSYSSYMGSAYLSYGTGRFQMDGRLSYDDLKSKNVTDSKAFYPATTVSTYNPRAVSSLGADLDLTMRYKAGERTWLTLTLAAPLVDRSETKDIENRAEYYSTRLDSCLVSDGIYRSRRGQFNSGLYLDHEFSEYASLSFKANYLRRQDENTRDFISVMEHEDGDSPEEHYETAGKTRYDILTASADLQFDLWGIPFTAGGKLSHIKTGSDDKYTGTVEQSNRFDYTENIGAVYLQGEKYWRHVQLSAGLRAEFSGTENANSEMPETYRRRYANLFPSASAMYRFGKDDSHSLSLQYSRRIGRPAYRYLNPFKKYQTKYSYTSGNPDLSPSFYNLVDLSYMYGDFLMVRGYYNGNTGKIGSLVNLDKSDTDKIIEYADNYLDVHSFGINLYAIANPAKWYSIVFQGDVSYDRYLSRVERFQDVSGFCGSLWLQQNFNILDGLQASISAVDYLPSVSDYRRREHAFGLDLKLEYYHRKTGLGISAELTDLLGTAEPRYSYVSDGVKLEYDNHYDSRSLMISLSWSFGTRQRQRPARASNTEERSRL